MELKTTDKLYEIKKKFCLHLLFLESLVETSVTPETIRIYQAREIRQMGSIGTPSYHNGLNFLILKELYLIVVVISRPDTGFILETTRFGTDKKTLNNIYLSANRLPAAFKGVIHISS